MPRSTVYPSSHYVTPRSTLLRAIESSKLELAERIATFTFSFEKLLQNRVASSMEFN